MHLISGEKKKRKRKNCYSLPESILFTWVTLKLENIVPRLKENDKFEFRDRIQQLTKKCKAVTGSVSLNWSSTLYIQPQVRG